MDSLLCRIVPMVAISFFFTSELMPPIDTISAYAAGSLLPANDISTDPFSMTITNCKKLLKKKRGFKYCLLPKTWAVRSSVNNKKGKV
jgi:hypothetical protein